MNNLESRMSSVQTNLSFLVDNTSGWRFIHTQLVQRGRLPKSLGFERFIQAPERWCQVYNIIPVWEG